MQLVILDGRLRLISVFNLMVGGAMITWLVGYLPVTIIVMFIKTNEGSAPGEGAAGDALPAASLDLLYFAALNAVYLSVSLLLALCVMAGLLAYRAFRPLEVLSLSSSADSAPGHSQPGR